MAELLISYAESARSDRAVKLSQLERRQSDPTGVGGAVFALGRRQKYLLFMSPAAEVGLLHAPVMLPQISLTGLSH